MTGETNAMRRSALTVVVNSSLLLVAILSLLASQAQAKRPMNKTALQKNHAWYDSSSAMYQTKYPRLDSLPPWRVDMPLDVKQAYVLIDSLMKSTPMTVSVERMSAWSSWNVTIKAIAKYFNELVDDDPISFFEYCRELSSHRAIYKNALLHQLVSNFEHKFLDLWPTDSSRLALYSLLVADGIYRVKIKSLDSMVEKPPFGNGQFLYEATAQVIDTLKGKRFKSVMLQDRTVQLKFLFSPRNYDVNPDFYYTKKDTALEDGKYAFHMKVGQEAIVFLTFQNCLVDSGFDYVDVEVDSRCSFNALSISGGFVNDINHVWSQGEASMPYTEWKARYSAYVRMLRGY